MTLGARAAPCRPRARRAAARARGQAGEVGRRRPARGGGDARAPCCAPRRGRDGRIFPIDRDLPPELEPLTTKPHARGRERPGRHRPGSSSRSWRSCPRRRRPRSARAPRRSTRSCAASSPRSTSSASSPPATRRRAPGRCARGRHRARGGRSDPLGHRARLHPRRGDPLGRPRRRGLARRGGPARACSASRARPTSSRTATSSTSGSARRARCPCATRRRGPCAGSARC